MKALVPGRCWRTLQNLIFADSCVLCGKPGDDGRELCAACLAGLPYNRLACMRCAAPLPVLAPDAVCGECLRRPPHYSRASSLLHYGYPVDRLIQRFKFNGKLHLARLFGDLLGRRLAELDGPLPELIIPVPLHISRLRSRGFNQSLELARPVARLLNIPLDYRSCIRHRATSTQSLLPAKEKHANVKGAFSVVRPLTVRHVALVDDVMTTGHTLNEMAGMLRQAGVEQVDVWVLARTSLDR